MYEFLDYRVEDVMVSPAVTLPPAASLADAEALFDKHDFNGLPVVDASGHLLGILTKLDLLKAFRFTDDHMFPPYETIMGRAVETVMTRDVLTVTPRAPLTRVLEKMIDAGTKSFPVVDEGRVVGMVAREDLIRGLRRAVSGEKPTGPI
jgi:CBS domain-containing protein